jgi:hypothetical protein
MSRGRNDAGHFFSGLIAGSVLEIGHEGEDCPASPSFWGEHATERILPLCAGRESEHKGEGFFAEKAGK